MSQKPLWEQTTSPNPHPCVPSHLRPVGWMSPKQRQNFQQWLGAEPDQAANGEPGERSRDADECQSRKKVDVIVYPLRWSSEWASAILVFEPYLENFSAR